MTGLRRMALSSVLLDDASRKILAAGEFQHANTANSIALVDKLVEDYWDIMPLEELISDNGSEFGAHRRNGKKEWDSKFKACRIFGHKADYSKSKASPDKR